MKRSLVIELVNELHQAIQEEVKVLLTSLIRDAVRFGVISKEEDKKIIKQYIRSNLRKYYETIERRDHEENLFFKHNGRWYFYKSKMWDVLKLFNQLSGKYLIGDATYLMKYLGEV